ncbi:phosphatidylinositol 4,5-bisphosphate 5-phosphatase A-like [Drosophila miranda]|uniref:phosphatidylinositol 4,5-bisphosphate 5-phosphatase A-like n=1 Tax=Drosophila miranda TaxID=7229 RepID=UPI00143F8B68|nr:phosphatidylinositol 4,5-bisphosphate 5-phosphatase A-like [Drosophila miranda]
MARRPQPWPPIVQVGLEQVDNHKYQASGYRRIFDHDFVFWFGDLNLRLSGDSSAWDVRTAAEGMRYDELLKQDQLNLLRETGNAFSLLEELAPKLAPTFKFIEGTNDYDLKRRPAWCDRILHRVQCNIYPAVTLSATQLSYQSNMEYTLSDHKPVSATFNYKVETANQTDEELHEMNHAGTSNSKCNLYSIYTTGQNNKYTLIRFLSSPIKLF